LQGQIALGRRRNSERSPVSIWEGKQRGPGEATGKRSPWPKKKKRKGAGRGEKRRKKSGTQKALLRRGGKRKQGGTTRNARVEIFTGLAKLERSRALTTTTG